MSLNGPKENANPTLHTVLDGSRRRRTRGGLGRSEIDRFNFRGAAGHDDEQDDDAEILHEHSGGGGGTGGYGCGDDVSWGISGRSAAERSVHLALMHAAESSGGRDVELLRDAGFVVPSLSDSAERPEAELREATFVPAVPPEGYDASATADMEDTMSSGEQKNVQGQQQRDEPADGSSSIRRDTIDAEEVFDTIRNVQDPEHPLTLEQLGVVRLDHVTVVDLAAGGDGASRGDEVMVDGRDGKRRQALSKVDVRFTPTIPHCSMATLIGLCLRVKLLRSLPSRFKVCVRIEPGTHASEGAVNRQLDDKERVRAALENDHLRGVVDKCIGNGMAMSASASSAGQ